jgi:branched-chain amino acid transport system substrate-binding protein
MKAMRGARRGVIVATALASALALASCSAGGGTNTPESSGGASKAPYKIGFNDDLSGPISFAGVTMLAGFQTYIDHVNSEGGVNGHPLEVQALDTRADGATSIANYKQLVEEFDALIVGGNSASGAFVATAPLAEEYKVPMFSQGAPDEFIADYHPWLYKSSMTISGQVDLMSQLLKDKIFPGSKSDGLKIGVLALDTAVGPVWFQAFQDAADKEGWEIVDQELVKPGATDCTAQAAKVAAAQPDIVLGSQTGGDDIVCFNQLKTNGYEGIYVSSINSPGENTYKRLASEDWIGLRTSTWWDDTSVEGTGAMLQQAVDFGHIGQFGSFSSDGYVQAAMIVDSLEECGDECTPEAVRDGLEALPVLDTRGVGAPANGYTDGDFGHQFKQARFFIWDDAAQHSVPYTDWMCLSYADCDTAEDDSK